MLAQNIRKLRKKQGLTLEKLSSLAGISISTLAKIEYEEAKEPTIITVIKIAAALNVSIDELVGRR